MQFVIAEFSVDLPVESGPLNETQVAAFQNATSSFVEEDVSFGNGRLDDAIVTVVSETMVELSNETTTANMTERRMTSWSELSLVQALRLNFTVTATYIGSDNNFDLAGALDPFFQQGPESLWFGRLAAADDIFASLAPEPASDDNNRGGVNSLSSETDTKNAGGISGGTVALVSVLAVAALGLSVAASVYSIRNYRRSAYGHELCSPRLSMTSSGLGSRIANENLEYHTRQLDMETRTDFVNRSRSDEEDEEKEEEAVDSPTSSWMGQNQPVSPNSLEKGGTVAFDQIMKNNPRIIEPVRDSWSHIISNNTGNRAKDPPSAESEISFSNEPQEVYQQQADPRAMSSLFDNNVSSVCRKFPFARHYRILPGLATLFLA
jgi:hypothetical protein